LQFNDVLSQLGYIVSKKVVSLVRRLISER